jgi:hypothetical protein
MMDDGSNREKIRRFYAIGLVVIRMAERSANVESPKINFLYMSSPPYREMKRKKGRTKEHAENPGESSPGTITSPNPRNESPNLKKD